jgi:DEAD/DEAH box helicase
MAAEESAAERKRKRLEAWRKRQQQQGGAAPVPPGSNPLAPAVKVSLSLTTAAAALGRNKKKSRITAIVKAPPSNPFGAVDDDDEDEDDSDEEAGGKRGKLTLGLGFSLEEPLRTGDQASTNEASDEAGSTKRRKKGRWDSVPASSGSINTTSTGPASSSSAIPGHPFVVASGHSIVPTASDALDKFMEKLEAGALGTVATQVESDETQLLSIDVGGSVMRVAKLKQPELSPVSGGVITAEQIAKLTLVAQSGASTKSRKISTSKEANPDALYTPTDWESDAQSTGAGGTASEAETEDEEEEENARRAFIEALKSMPNLDGSGEGGDVDDDEKVGKPTLAAEVKSEKSRREQMLRDLEREAGEARSLAEKSGTPELGRFYNDVEGGVMEEAERNLDAAMAAPDALQVIAELNKKKELKNVDHSTVDYIPFRKNLYIVPRALANLSSDQVADLRGKLKVKVRGHGAPAPVSSFEQCGLSERIMKVMEKQGITKPFPVQAQCLPCIMAGRDVIGIAKTGSGKTLAYLLPLLRHILDQPPLGPSESGPIGLILAPARELAYQIHLVCKSFTKSLGLK